MLEVLVEDFCLRNGINEKTVSSFQPGNRTGRAGK